MEHTVKFEVQYEGRIHSLESNNNEYRNLMTLLKDKMSPDDFGQCGGIGRCGTCLVKISAESSDCIMFYRNEQETLRKIGVVDPEIRLSCQIYVNENLKNVVVQLLDNN